MNQTAPSRRENMDNEIIIRAEGLTKEVPSPEGPLTILDDISLSLIHISEPTRPY